jgi:putative Holliday junction resolvase
MSKYNMVILDAHEFIKALKSNFTLVGIDHGMKKIGLASYNRAINVPLPIKIIDTNLDTLAKELRELNADGIVIGLPLNMQSEETDSTKRVKKFAEKLALKTTAPITFFDERMSTKMANTLLQEAGMKRNARNNVDDMLAAHIILDSFVRKYC